MRSLPDGTPTPPGAISSVGGTVGPRTEAGLPAGHCPTAADGEPEAQPAEQRGQRLGLRPLLRTRVKVSPHVWHTRFSVSVIVWRACAPPAETALRGLGAIGTMGRQASQKASLLPSVIDPTWTMSHRGQRIAVEAEPEVNVQSTRCGPLSRHSEAAKKSATDTIGIPQVRALTALLDAVIGSAAISTSHVASPAACKPISAASALSSRRLIISPSVLTASPVKHTPSPGSRRISSMVERSTNVRSRTRDSFTPST